MCRKHNIFSYHRAIFLNFAVVFLLFFLCYVNCHAQLQGTQWIFGDSAYIDFRNPSNPVTLSSAINTRGSCSSVADSSGNLLFYCGAVSGDLLTECSFLFKFNYVYNKNHNIIANGSCLSGSGWYDEHIIIQMPENDSLFYLFSLDNILDHGLAYSIVNMKANEGLGEVIETNHFLVQFFHEGDYYNLTLCIKAVRHANGRDWWLVAKAGGLGVQEFDEPNVYHLFLITPNGIESYLENNNIENSADAWAGCSHGFNKGGNRMFYICDNIGIYNFDRCTGNLSNYLVLDSGGFTIDKFYWSAEFSPGGKYLYAIQMPKTVELGDTYYLLQYDLESDNPALSKDTLSIFGPEFFPDPDPSFIDAGALRLAPDNKIYTSQFYVNGYYNWPWPDSVYNEVNMNLSVINYPDSAYPACGFEPFSFGLGGKRTYGGLPNNPNYNLGPIDGSSCDSLGITGLIKKQSYLKSELNIFPNPCHNFCQIEYKPAKQNGSILITDAQGKIVFKEENIPVTLLQHGYEINLSTFPKGSYNVTITSGSITVSKQMVKM